VHESDHALFKSYADLIKQADPHHPRLFVSGEDSSTLGANLRPFTDTSDVLGSDIYPIGTSEPIAAVGTISHAVQSIADRSGKPLVLVLQTFSIAQYQSTSTVCSLYVICPPFPTEMEIRQMRDLAVGNAHPLFILWYSYFDIERSNDSSAHLNNLVQALSSLPTSP
jgi:hypothetical protein